MMYHLRQMWVAVRGTLTATFATLSTMTITLAVLGSVILLTLNLERNLVKLESEVEIGVFIQEGSTLESVALAIQTQYGSLIKDAKLVTKDQAMQEMTELYPSFDEAEDLVENPLPDTLRLKLKDPQDTKRVAEAIKTLNGVESVEYGQGTIDQSINLIRTLRTGGWTLVGVLVLSSFFNILNAVRVAMYARREEINVMRLLGATRRFIRAPYLMEGILLGLLSSAVACMILVPSYVSLVGNLQNSVPFLSLVTEPLVVLQSLAGLFLFGLVIGSAGSWFASNHYLRELE
ncbi:cell division protein FtsX [Deinococcus cellulosilyticus]|uniref:Cell division protein FtsX n=1 Tax=Deinococcus cellulosilyticus (strain DSM 18568 / NBRC 106333 / KACC 11606 / 5516J-15) TaxID=1223518 RepID=A0A511N5Q2_DEIC1|nr:permease-like cell division protein FtsX [Deinococcus cellulosilyticus]GEM48185.1 hypothetical protein DC3_38200 [Deinococcus cellulosilyticus NBRC 106333 = KACC 11606]